MKMWRDMHKEREDITPYICHFFSLCFRFGFVPGFDYEHTPQPLQKPLALKQPVVPLIANITAQEVPEKTVFPPSSRPFALLRCCRP